MYIHTQSFAKVLNHLQFLSKHHFVKTKNQFNVTKSCLIIQKRKEYVIINHTKQ